MKVADLDKVLVCDCFSGLCLLTSYYCVQQRAALIEANMQVLKRGYEDYKEKVIIRTMPNNWLKLHGYRMRRKVR